MKPLCALVSLFVLATPAHFVLATPALLVLATPGWAADFKPPFDTRLPAAKSASRPCAPLSAPIISLDLPSKYGASGQAAGTRRDVVDSAADAAFSDAMAPIKTYMGDVVKAANDYQRTGSPSAANCALDHLVHWAKGQGLSAPNTHTSWFKLATTVAGLSAALMQIEPALADRRADAELARRWLGQRGQAISRYFDELPMPRAARNNHRAWAGLAVASAGVVARDSKLVAWGADSLRLVSCQATLEGALPLELERGSKALEYHLYALAALMPLAEITARAGGAPYETCAGALHRIAAFTVKGIADPAHVAALAGAAQSGKAPSASKLVFLEPYLARFPDRLPEARRLLAQRPLGLTDLGGNQTLLYAR
jgi:poly(beta-D-mannuronate) lyase